MIRGTIVVGLLIGCGASQLLAAGPPSILSEYSLASWGVKDGLTSAVISAIAQDPDGYLWLGTDAGLVRFDGSRFTHVEALWPIDLVRAPIRVLHISRDGTLWVGYNGAGGISRIAHGEARNFGPAQGLSAGPVTMLFEEDAGKVWAGNRDGLFAFAGDRWHQVGPGLIPGPVYTAHVDRTGQMLVGTVEGLFRRAPGSDEFVRLGAGDAASSRLRDAEVRDISEDQLGRLWLSDSVFGFRELSERRPGERHHKGRGAPLLHDHRGNMWVGTYGQGLWRVRFDGAAHAAAPIQVSSAATGLSDDGVMALLEDRDRNIWAATVDGLNRFTPYKAIAVTELGPVNAVELAVDGGVWVGTADALVHLPPESSAPDREQPLMDPPLTALHADERGTLWAATNGGLLRVVKGQPERVRLPGPDPPRQITSISSDQRGGIWLFDLSRGLLNWNQGRLYTPTLPAEMRTVVIISMYTDRHGRLWLATDDGRLAVAEGTGPIQLRGRQDGVDGGNYRAIAEDDSGVLWFGGTSGLTRFANGRFETLLAADGLPAESITAIVEDRTGDLWLGANGSGLVRVSRAELDKAFAAGSPRLSYSFYDRSDGVAGTPRSFGNRSAVRGRDGRLWFVAGRGLTVVDPQKVSPNAEVAFPVHIEGLVADGQRLRTAPLTLAARSSRLQIEYSVLNLTTPLRNRFRYRLDGIDPDWVDAGARRQAFYTNLPPGRYQFRVVSSAHGQNWNSEPLVWSFSIPPAFYQTGWFMAACLGAVMLTVAGMWRLRLRQLRKRFLILLAERMNLSREIHDTLLQALVGVSLQFDVIAGNVDSPSPPIDREQMVRMRKYLEDYIGEARQFIWDLRSPTLGNGDLPTALRQVVARATAGARIDCQLIVTGTPQPCPVDIARQLRRIGHEAATNVVRHAHATRMLVSIDYLEDAIRLRLADDGRGFSPAASPGETDGHYGLVMMKERAVNVGGELTITSTVGRGTTIETVVPTSGSGE
jgi:signal transduction histidine kinase/ligand-binding sensor domain-containing protein